MHTEAHTLESDIAAFVALLSDFLIGQCELSNDVVAMLLDNRSTTSIAVLYSSIRFVIISISESLCNS